MLFYKSVSVYLPTSLTKAKSKGKAGVKIRNIIKVSVGVSLPLVEAVSISLFLLMKRKFW